MKYIRTDKGVYERDKCKSALWKMKVIKEADTIEELSDEFVFHTMDGKEQFFISQGHLKDVLSNKNINLKNYLSCREIYAAIWTNKGLIFVAKINKDGVLELL